MGTKWRSRGRGSMRGLVRSPKGAYSEIGTLILVAAALVVTVAATFVSFNILESQSQIAEYENAKSALVGAAELIEGLSESEGLAGYSRMYVRSGGLDIVDTGMALTIKIDAWTAIEALPFAMVKFRGGRHVSGSDYSVLRGESNSEALQFLIIPPSLPEIPLGWVFVKREGGANILMDFGRVRVNMIGTLNVTTQGGAAWELVNIVEIVFIRLSRGPTYGRDVFDLRAQNKKITVVTNKLQGTTFEVLAVRGSTSQTYNLVCPDKVDNKPVTGTIFNVVVIDIEVGTQ